MALPTIRSSLVLLSLFVLWSTAARSSPTAGTAPAPVRVGVVLDLRSYVGRERRACVSKALHDFDLKHPSYAGRVELLVRDSLGDLAASTHAAEDLIKNSQVQAIIWAPQTLTTEDLASHLGYRHNHVQVISLSNISSTSCAFWLEADPVTASGGHPKLGFTLGNGSTVFLNLETGRRHNRVLATKETQDCTSKTKLKIAVPRKYGFLDFVKVAIDPITKMENITGYSIDIFEAAMHKLHPRPCYNLTVFDGPYDELVGNVSIGMYDSAVGDVTITAERVNGTDFTMPYTQSGVSMLVLAEDEPNTVSWTFVKPLSSDLWFATIAFFFYTGFVLWMIELPTNQEYQGSKTRQCSTALYFIFSTLTFSHGQIIRSPLSKIVVVIWCFVVLILVQSYTASLSSILTAKRLRPQVKDLDQLRKNGDFVGYQEDSFVWSLLNISESKLKSYTTKEEYAKALRQGSNNGGVSAIVDEIPYINSFLSDPKYKNDFRMVGSLFKSPGFGFAFHQGSPLVHNLSIAILNLTSTKEVSQIEEKWFGTSSAPTDDGIADSGPLTFQSFSGLFVITGSISSLMLLISIVRWVYAKYMGLRNVSYSGVDVDWIMLQNAMGDNPNHDQQSFSEADNDDLRGVHVSRENAPEGAPGPEPARHVQVEMTPI